MRNSKAMTIGFLLAWIVSPGLQRVLVAQEELESGVNRARSDSTVQQATVNGVDLVVQQEIENRKIQEYRVQRNSQIQTFRINRVVQQDGVKRMERRQVRMAPSIQKHIHIENRVHPIGWNGFQMIPSDAAIRSGQIIVEMKTGSDEHKKDVAIGMFAPGSWIKSNNGIVHLYTEQFDAPMPVVNRYWIGVRCREMASTPVATADLVVDEVVANSSAEKAGIRVKDRLVRWNRTPLRDIETLVTAIQNNKDAAARIQVRRGEMELDLAITPQTKTSLAPVRTIIAPATRLNVAEQRIDELQKLIKVSDGTLGQQVRLLLVGPAVNFGKEEIELQIKRDVQQQKKSLKKFLENVANKKMGMIIDDDDSFTFKKDPDVSSLNVVNFEPHEIWETMEIGTDGKMISFATMAPRMIKSAKVQFELKKDDILDRDLPQTVHQLKTGQIVFPNPLGTFDFRIRKQIDQLKGENDRFRSENAKLKEQINKLRGQLEQQK